MITSRILTPSADMSARECDDYWMQQAFVQAKFVWGQGGVPVGTVVMRGNEVVRVGYNAPTDTHDPSAHAETRTLRQAAEKLDNYRLSDCEIFTTLKPCVMCTGVVLHAHVARVVYGAPDPKTGAADSIPDPFAEMRLSHQTAITGGALVQECDDTLRAFPAEHHAIQKTTRLVATESDEFAT